MTLIKKLDFFNNIFGFFGILYTILIFAITFLFKENSQKIMVIAVPVFLLVAIMVVLTLIVIDYFKRRFSELQQLNERMKKLEEVLALDARFRSIEESLIRQEHQLVSMQKNNASLMLGRKGNASFLYVLLAILLLALLVWLVLVLRT